jgi:ribosomal protein S18 acetylase RimI-like enzyme
VGRRLLDYAIDLATLAGHRVAVSELRLTVADSNQRAQRLFRRCGFDVLDARHGAYDGGQVAIRMRRRLGQ